MSILPSAQSSWLIWVTVCPGPSVPLIVGRPPLSLRGVSPWVWCCCPSSQSEPSSWNNKGEIPNYGKKPRRRMKVEEF